MTREMSAEAARALDAWVEIGEAARKRASIAESIDAVSAVNRQQHEALEATVARLAMALALPAERMAELREHVHAAARDLYTTTGHTYASALALIEDTLIGGGFERMADALRGFAEKAVAAGVEIGDALRPLVPKLPPSEIDWTALEIPALRPRKRAGGYTRGLLRRLRRTT